MRVATYNRVLRAGKTPTGAQEKAADMLANGWTLEAAKAHFGKSPKIGRGEDAMATRRKPLAKTPAGKRVLKAMASIQRSL